MKATAKPARHTKHTPQRTCVGCQRVLPKRELIRLVRRPSSVEVDLKGKMDGRGAYLHNQRSCWERGLKGSLARALKVTLTETDLHNLHAFMLNLPEEESQATGV